MNMLVEILGKRSRQRINELPGLYRDNSLEKYFSLKSDSLNRSQSTLHLIEYSGCYMLHMEQWSS